MLAMLVSTALFASMPFGDIQRVDRDDVEIHNSCTVVIDKPFIADNDGDGVVQITGDNITVDFAGSHLHGAAANRSPADYEGFGVVVTGENVTLRNVRVSGFKCGVLAQHANGLVIEDTDISGNFKERLYSTPEAEDGRDWLFPHRNEERQWLNNYGAGMYIASSRDVTLRRIRARDGQNGIILDSVTDSRVYDNDCSFLSGWGLAMWRSSRNVISRNAFDFCVRGYSHGIYNRGQDSAGILMFEQCNENVIAENSVTHGGDGFFGFAGRDALGEAWLEQERARLREALNRDDVDDEVVYPPSLLAYVHRRGNNDNLLINNDFSYAPAHGIEMTFSFDNRFIGNRMIGNAICGIWGGYSQDTLIAGNHFESNGDGAYGLERGGVNIEHGRGNLILGNTFRDNKCGVHLWWDPDQHLMVNPWAKANHPDLQRTNDGGIARGTLAAGRMLPSIENVVAGNAFSGDLLGIELREAGRTYLHDNTFASVAEPIRSAASTVIDDPEVTPSWSEPRYPVFGETHPVGARQSLRGREKIIITEWGPYDWESPLLRRVQIDEGAHIYELLGNATIHSAEAQGQVAISVLDDESGNARRRIRVTTKRDGAISPYTILVNAGSATVRADGVLASTTWEVSVFPWNTDPRENLDAWYAEAAQDATNFTMPVLRLPYGGGGVSDVAHVPESVRKANLPTNQFGTIATTRAHFPAGKWEVVTMSDDGLRVWVDGELVIDDWTWHAPRQHRATLDFEESSWVEIRVEHFELDGAAVLDVDFRPASNGVETVEGT